MYKLKKKNSGITLIALVITIVVLLILAGISISMLTGNNGILGKAGEAKNKTSQAQYAEELDTALMGAYTSGVGKYTQDKLKEILNSELGTGNYTISGDEENGWTIEYKGEKRTVKATGETIVASTGGTTNVEDVIPTSEEEVKTGLGNEKGYVGYYADIDGNGTVDGIIYADLAVNVSGQWGDDWGDYSYRKIGNLKEYAISQENYNGDFGTKPVLKVVNSTGNDRIYVMALKDVALDGTSTADRNSIYWNWYYDALDSSTSTGKLDESMNIPSTGEGSDDFGQGKSKTLNMITKWNQEVYGTKNAGDTYKDLWGIFSHTNNTIGTVDSSKWFIPSKGEWSAFGGNLQISKENSDDKYYVNLGLSDWYWLSSQYYTHTAYGATFGYGSMFNNLVRSYYFVRLSTTF